MTASPAPLATHGWFIDLGGLWVKYDTIGTIKDVEGESACLVVLTIPGYKTLRVACSAAVLVNAVTDVRGHVEVSVGIDRAKGMRHSG